MNDTSEPVRKPEPASSPSPLVNRPSPPALNPAEQVRRAIAALRRRWLAAAAVFLFVIAATAVYTWRQPLAYTATANLVVNARVLNVVSPDQGVVPTAPPGDAAVNTEVQILQSDEVARRVAQAMDAGPIPHFSEQLTNQPLAEARERVAGALRSKLAIARPGSTNVLGVSYTSTDPTVAALIANEFARQYLVVKSSTRQTAARSADVELAQQLETLRGEVESAEAAVAHYRQANNLLTADGSTLTEQEVSLYKQQDAAAETTLAEDHARLNTARAQLRGGSEGGDVGEALGSGVISGLRQQRAQASAKLAELQARYKPGYPDVVKAKSQLADIDSAIQGEIGRVVSNLEARVQVSEQRAATARSITGSAQGQLATNTAASVRLGELQRRADALRSTYASMLARRNAVTSEAMIGTGDARIFSPATVPERPTSPNRKLNMAIGGVMGLLLAGVTVWLLQAFDRGIVTSADAERSLGLPHLANIPLLRSIARGEERRISPVDFVLERPLSLLAEATRNILLAAERGSRRRGVGLLAITSSRPEEGKTTLAIIAARASAFGGRPTLLLDADVRRPSVAATLGLTPVAGLIEVLSGQATIKEALLKDEASGCWVMPTLVKRYAPDQMPTSERIAELFGQLAGMFDTVIVDTAPVLAAVESRIILQHVDGVVFAVRWKKTLLPLVRASLKRLASVDVEPIGVVLTMADMRAIERYGPNDVDHGYRTYENYGYS